MAFGDSAVLIDDLQRASVGPNWTGPIIGDTTNITVTANGARDGAAAGYSAGYYNVASYGPDVETHIQINTLPSGVSDQIVMMMVRYNEATQNGYAIEFDRAGRFVIVRIDAGAQVGLATITGGPSLAGGDKVGVEMIGSSLVGWYNPAGAGWQTIPSVSATDATYSNAGRIGLETRGNAELLVNLNGATVTAPLVPAKLDSINFSDFPKPALRR